MIKVLHYIPELKKGNLNTAYFNTLIAEMEKMAEVKAITRKTPSKIICEFKPDILHIHVVWDSHVMRIIRKAAHNGIPVVVSPHWQLNQYTRHNEKRLRKLAKAQLYAKHCIRKSDALLVTSDDERQQLTQLGWKTRINVIPNCILNNSISAEEMCKDTMCFYKKVFDTRYELLMTDHEKEAICSLLHVGMAHDTSKTLLSSDKILTLRALKPDEWRRIYLYADDEDIRDIINNGIALMQLNAPVIDTRAIDRFPTIHPKDKGPLRKDTLLSKNPLVKSKLEDEINNGEGILKTIAIMLLNSEYLIQKGTFSMRHLAELYDMIKYEDYDEDRLKEIITRMKIKRFTERMTQIMSDELYLEEGFQPVAARQDKKTELIRQQLLH